MDLTYNPGELDFKHSVMKRDHDSVDDFEHLDPESSPVDVLSKPLVDIDSKSDNLPITDSRKDLEVEKDQSQITKTDEIEISLDTSVTNGKDKSQAFHLDSKNTTSNSDLISTPPGFEIASNSIPKSVESSLFDNSLISNFISAEKESNSFKTQSDLVGFESSGKDSSNHENESHGDVFKSTNDIDLPAKSMKEADAMSHYELKLDKKELEKKDMHSEGEKNLESEVKFKSKYSKEQDDDSSKDNDAVGTTNLDFKEHQATSKEENIADREHKVEKEEKHLENKDELSSSEKLEHVGPESFVTSPEPDVNLINEKKETHEEEFKDFPSRDEITKKSALICPSKPESSVSDLDDIIGPEDVFKRIGMDAWFTPGGLHPIVEALVYWRDPKKSGVVFGGVMAILLSICYMSLISVVGHSMFLIVTAAICFRIYKNILQAIQKTSSEGHPFKDYLELDLSLPQDKVREMTDTAVVHINAAIVELRRLILVEDLVDSVKFGLFMWTLTYIGALFNGMTLVILAFVALFTVPKIYENNKASIDMYIELGRSKVAEITSKVKAAVPIGKKEPEKDKEQ